MAFTAISIGAVAEGTAGVAVSTTAITCQVGDLMVIGVTADSASGANVVEAGMVTDDDGNTYTMLTAQVDPANNAGLVAVGIYWSRLTTVTGGNVIVTYTPPSGVAKKTISACSLRPQGVGTVVTGSDNSASGTGTAPSVANAGTLAANDAIFGIIGWEGLTGDLTATDSDTTNGAWDAFPGTVGTSGGGATSNISGAAQVKSKITAAGTQTYNVTLGTSRDWGGVIAAFRDDIRPRDVKNPPGGGHGVGSGQIKKLRPREVKIPRSRVSSRKIATKPNARGI